MYLVVFYVGEYVWVCGCVYKIENFRTLTAPSEIASLREAISSSAAFELLIIWEICRDHIFSSLWHFWL
jgi:hypothetical protein